MAGQGREARLRTDDPAIHDKEKAGSEPGLFIVTPRYSAHRMSSSAKADDPVCRGLSIVTKAGDYWMPAVAGMTGVMRNDSRIFSSLRANGSRECAPDDRLREAIHDDVEKDWIASLLRSSR
jgi:hypothetical protein